MSSTTSCLTKLLRKDEPWVWGPHQQAAFEAIKAVFAHVGLLVLRPIDYDRPLMHCTHRLL